MFPLTTILNLIVIDTYTKKMDENESTHITVAINRLMILNPLLITQQRAAPIKARAQLSMRLPRRKDDRLQTKDVRRRGAYPRNPRKNERK